MTACGAKTTDLEEWRAILNKFKINFIEGRFDSLTKGNNLNNTIFLEVSRGVGYFGLFAVYFNSDGSFKSYGVWE